MLRGVAAITASQGGRWDPDALTVIAASSVPLTDARKNAINNFVRTCKGANIGGRNPTGVNVWSSLDFLHVQGVPTAQFALKNWRSPGTFDLTVVGAPTFTAAGGSTPAGYAGNGGTANLSGPNLATFGGQYARDSSHMGVYVGTDATEGTPDINSSITALIRSHAAANTVQTRANDSTTTSITVAGVSAVGHSMWSRAASDTYAFYKDGVAVGTPNPVSVASTGITSANLIVCGSTKVIQASHCGAPVTAAGAAVLSGALNDLLIGLGSIPFSGVFLGDSFTLANGSFPDLPNASYYYPALVEASLHSAGARFAAVNKGVAGYTTENIIASVLPSVPISRNLGFACVLAGVNDSLNKTQENLITIGQTLVGYGYKRLMICNQPFRNTTTGGDTLSTQVYGTLRGRQEAAFSALAAQYAGSVDVQLCDYFNGMKDLIVSGQYAVGDGLWQESGTNMHPNALGETIMGQILFAKLQSCGWAQAFQ